MEDISQLFFEGRCRKGLELLYEGIILAKRKWIKEETLSSQGWK